MSTPHLHTQRLLQDLEHLTKLARAEIATQRRHYCTAEEQAQIAITEREVNNIIRRLKKELRRLGPLNGPKKVLP